MSGAMVRCRESAAALMVRFDDTIATVLASAPQQGRGRVVAWRQLVDLLAQGRPSARREDALGLLRAAREDVPAAVRGEIAAAYAALGIPADLVAFFAEDRLSIAAPLLGRVRLSAEAWLALLPLLTPAARSVLRNRRDLEPAVARGLASFGPSDLVVAPPEAGSAETVPPVAEAHAPEIPTAVPDAEAADLPTARATSLMVEPEPAVPAAAEPAAAEGRAGGSQIRDLLDRIESFRERRAGARPASATVPDAAGFAFETDAEGRIVWVEGVPRGPLIGQTIAVAGSDYGVDGQAAGAFRRRAPFRNARLTVAGSGPGGGDWRISAVPFFDHARGRFEGYRGSARRPRRDEVAGEAGTDAGLLGSSLAPDSLRQLVHELRTPLNAIQGFADMIEGQMLGPAPANYRGRAAEIASQARRLLGAVDDLDVAARVEGDRIGDEPGVVDGAELLCRLHAEQLPLAHEAEVDLRFTLAERLPALAITAAAAERMISRLLAATVGVAARGETVAIGYDRDPGAPSALRLSVSRPATLAGLSEAQLLDPGFSPAGEFPSAPALGLGFALRLVSNLARAAGAHLVIGEDHFALLIPAAAEPAAERGSG